MSFYKMSRSRLYSRYAKKAPRLRNDIFFFRKNIFYNNHATTGICIFAKIVSQEHDRIANITGRTERGITR